MEALLLYNYGEVVKVGYNFQVYETYQSKANDTTLCPISPGQYIICIDSGNVYYDTMDNLRKLLTDIIDLETDEERTSILAPLDKVYFVKETAHFWRYLDGQWIDLTMVADGSNEVSCTLFADAWSNGKQTITVNGLGATQNGVIGVAQDITETQMDAVRAAGLYVCGQSLGSLTIATDGNVPTCNIPARVIMLD